jgi:hypothetical protein
MEQRKRDLRSGLRGCSSWLPEGGSDESKKHRSGKSDSWLAVRCVSSVHWHHALTALITERNSYVRGC